MEPRKDPADDANATDRGSVLMARALVIGNSSGIGLATTRALLAAGWEVAGISRSLSPITDPAYRHLVADVRSPTFGAALRELSTARTLDACIYCAGIGEPTDIEDLTSDVRVFEVNVMGALATATTVIPPMIRAGSGHLIVLSSQADEIISPRAPSYAASKAALSLYFEGLALALRSRGVAVTNVRFGFVDTKMAKASARPFLISAEKAAAVVVRALRMRPVRITYPLRMAILASILRWLGRWRVRWHSLL
jgi:NAD(P)-dependent dehydrogenase (short-subunit alcohol dehydrogenase family)